jgi:molybdopterin synthase sulfur carrier subunit
MATVIIPALLRKYTGGVDRLEVEGRSVREILRKLAVDFPVLVNHLVENDELKPSIAVSVDGEVSGAGVLEKVGPSSEVHFIPAIGGGQ